MSPNLTIRESLRPGDIGEVLRLHGVIYGAETAYDLAFEAYVAETLAEFVYQYDPSRDRVWLCEDADKLVGMLFLMHRDAAAQLRYFLVLPEYRGHGIGKELMERYRQALDELGYSHSFLWTAHELPTAAALYRQHGFVLTDEVPSERFGKRLVEHKYEWHR